MTRTISLIIGIAVVALVAVPTAFAEGRLAGSNDQSGVAYFRANELSTLVQQPVQVDRRTDAFDRTAPSSQPNNEGLNRFERRESGISAHGLSEFAPTVNVDLPTAPESVPVAASGREVEWPQIGIGFGIGIALAIVLGLSLKATRPRTMAH